MPIIPRPPRTAAAPPTRWAFAPPVNSGGAGEELAGGVPEGVSLVPVGITGREEVDDALSVGSGALVGSLVLDEVRVIPSFSAQVWGSMPCSSY